MAEGRARDLAPRIANNFSGCEARHSVALPREHILLSVGRTEPGTPTSVLLVFLWRPEPNASISLRGASVPCRCKAFQETAP